MRKIILMLLCVFTAFIMVGQTQQGHVKTKGRRANNKLVAGSPLAGVSIQVKGGNTVVSTAAGKFSIQVPSKKYYLQSVKKSGYVLVDPDILLKSYTYSSNPLVIVMDTPEQKNDDRLAAERKIRRTLQRQMEAKEDRIEELMEQNQITQQQYREAMQALHEEQQRNGDLISEMAERYAQLDYDQMDDFNQQVNDLILEGLLTQADSLLRTKGDVDARIAEVQREEEAQNAEKLELQRRQQNLEASLEGTRAKKNDIAQDCYNYFKKFVLEMQHDSALHYIEKRASIDPHNSHWQFDAASYCQKRGLTQKADTYYQKVLQEIKQLSSDNPEEYEPELAWTLNNAALLASRQPHDTRAAGYFQEAIGIFDKLAETNPQVYQPYLASALNNLALHYSNNNNGPEQSEPLFQEALDIYWKFAQDDAKAYIPRVAAVLNNLALLYDQGQQFDKSEEYYQQALGIYRRLAETSPKTYNPDVATTLNNLSALYYRNGQNGEQPLTQALEIYRQLEEDDPQLYGPQLAALLHNLSVQYYGEGRDDEGEEACSQSLDIYRKVIGSGSSEYKPELARRLYEHAIRLYKDDQFKQSEPLFKESLSLYRELALIDPAAYQADIPKVLRNLATTYDQMNRLSEGEKMYQEELDINLALAQQEPSRYKADVARSYGNLSNHAMLMKDFDKAIELANKGIAVDDSKLFIQANLALAYLCLGETARAEEIYSRYKSQLHDMFLDDLEVFTTLGIIPKERHADVERIRHLLAK